MRLFFTVLLTQSIFMGSITGQSWEKVLDQEGIQVYTTDVEHSKYQRFKATTIVDASIHQLVALFKEVDEMSSWLSQCKTAKLIRSNDFWHQVTYHEVNVPVFRNRDMILDMQISQDSLNQTLRINIEGKPAYLPEEKRIIRVHEVNGYWSAQRMDDGRLFIEYSMFIDPAGYVPAWLYNQRIKNDPFETLLNMRSSLSESVFKEAFYSEVVPLAKR